MKHWLIVFSIKNNFYHKLSTVQFSSEQWTIVFSKNEAVENCLLKEITTGKLSSEHWTIVFSKIDSMTTDTAMGVQGQTLALVGLVNPVKYQVRLGLVWLCLVRFG